MKKKPAHFQSDKIYAAEQTNLKKFSFNQQVVDVFPDMINRSVPGYSNIIEGIGKLAAQYCPDNPVIYDLGCSLGSVSLSIAKHAAKKSPSIKAVDNSKAMIERCQQHISAYSHGNSIELFEGDLLNITLSNCDMVVINFTLQFVEPSKRQDIIDKVFNNLKPGGILVLSEKIRHENNNIDNLLVSLHHDFKRENGYSELEISQKRSALEDVMILDSSAVHQARLKQAGFTDSSLWFQHFNFLSIVAIKEDH